VNTNLEQVSDWLTKVLIGAALVTLPSFVRGEYGWPQVMILDAAPPSWNAKLLIVAIVYFAPTGLFAGYLICQLFAAGDLTHATLLRGINIALDLPLETERFVASTISPAERQAPMHASGRRAACWGRPGGRRRLLRSSEMTRWANSGIEDVGSSKFLT
jgi:hypothetical protein